MICWNAGTLDSTRIKILKLLLENGADVNAKNNEDGDTTLMYLVKERGCYPRKLRKAVKAILDTDRVVFGQKNVYGHDIIDVIIEGSNSINKYDKLLEITLEAFKRSPEANAQFGVDVVKKFTELQVTTVNAELVTVANKAFVN